MFVARTPRALVNETRPVAKTRDVRWCHLLGGKKSCFSVVKVSAPQVDGEEGEHGKINYEKDFHCTDESPSNVNLKDDGSVSRDTSDHTSPENFVESHHDAVDHFSRDLANSNIPLWQSLRTTPVPHILVLLSLRRPLILENSVESILLS